MSGRGRRALPYVVFAIPLACVAALASYYAWATSVATAESHHAGWSVRYSYARGACFCCTSRVISMTVNGRPLDLSVRAPWAHLVTPVGTFHYDARAGYFSVNSHPVPQDWEESSETITPIELERGYYDAEHDVRKRGTPESWCYVTTPDSQRILDPLRGLE